MILDVLYFMHFRVGSTPGRLVRYGSSSAGDTVDDEDCVCHGIGRDKFDVGFFRKGVH